MLRTETVTPATLELLKGLMTDEKLNKFFLAGGTALSLQIGHRISIDLDFFALEGFDGNTVSAHLEKRRGFTLDFLNKNTLKGKIDGVIVDFITHAYPLINEIKIIDGVRLASLEDIAAMKLNAIVGNGTRLKDFVDIACMSAYLSLNDMLNAYEHKYRTRNQVLVIKCLSFFDDIIQSEPIRMLGADYSWGLVAKRIMDMTEHPGIVFLPIA